jgi:hypothetical protein
LEKIMSVIKLSSASIAAIQAVATADATAERATLAALPVLRAEFAGVDRDVIRATVIVNFAGAWGITLKVQGTGRVVFPKDDARSETAKKACNRFLERLLADGEGSARTAEEIAVPPHIAKLAKQLAQACAEYEGARKLASTAVAQAFAK